MVKYPSIWSFNLNILSKLMSQATLKTSSNKLLHSYKSQSPSNSCGPASKNVLSPNLPTTQRLVKFHRRNFFFFVSRISALLTFTASNLPKQLMTLCPCAPSAKGQPTLTHFWLPAPQMIGNVGKGRTESVYKNKTNKNCTPEKNRRTVNNFLVEGHLRKQRYKSVFNRVPGPLSSTVL